MNFKPFKQFIIVGLTSEFSSNIIFLSNKDIKTKNLAVIL